MQKVVILEEMGAGLSASPRDSIILASAEMTIGRFSGQLQVAQPLDVNLGEETWEVSSFRG